ncbi:MAG: alginate export family protein [Gemmobacter sp.]|nr:alginate export family protein [Gemmobacter sp.]
MASIMKGGLPTGAALLLSGGAHARTLPEAIAAGKPIFEVRPRYEAVDQANLAREAQSLHRPHPARLGDRRLARHEGADRVRGRPPNRRRGLQFRDQRQDAVPGGRRSRRDRAEPAAGDLDAQQVFSATLGRQRINLDDQRFIGAVAWRQDEQTFDAARADATLGKLKVTAAYIGHVNRAVAEAADWDAETWLVNATLPVTPAFTPQAFVYALDFDNAAASSNITWGVRATGKWKAGDVALAYAGSLARQSDHGEIRPSSTWIIAEAEISATYKIATVKAAYRSLEGNGLRGLRHTLATLHAFQGWADAFLVTPVNGIDDTNLTLVLKPKLGAMPVELTAATTASKPNGPARTWGTRSTSPPRSRSPSA